MEVSNMTSQNGNKIANQFIIEDDTKIVFQSYNTIIAIKENNNVILDSNALEYSNTTLKYLKQFLNTGDSKKSLYEKIASGLYTTSDLN